MSRNPQYLAERSRLTSLRLQPLTGRPFAHREAIDRQERTAPCSCDTELGARSGNRHNVLRDGLRRSRSTNRAPGPVRYDDKELVASPNNTGLFFRHARLRLMSIGRHIEIDMG